MRLVPYRNGICLWAIVAFVGTIACNAPGVGDPCIPENIPDGGFDQQEVYLETSSVQCRTRVCMVYQLDGNPAICEEGNKIDGEEATCSTESGLTAWNEEVDSRVYCTCRCDGPPDVTADFCSCPSGFRCEKIFDQEGRPGLKGSYCIDDRTPRREGT